MICASRCGPRSFFIQRAVQHARHELGRRSRAPVELLSRCFVHPGRGRRRTQDDAAERSVRPAWCLSRARWPHECILLRCGRRPRRELHHAREHRLCFWLLVAHVCTAPVAVRSTCACTFGRVRVICCTAAVCVACWTSVFKRPVHPLSLSDVPKRTFKTTSEERLS